jgi:hypothetical protein
MTRSNNLAVLAVVGSALVAVATPASAKLVGATYDFNTSTTGNTQIGAVPGTYTDPSNPGFCVGPPVACSSGSGMFGFFSFASPSPTMSTITFQFFGSTAGAGPGSFELDLSNFVTTDGEKIDAVTYSSGNLIEGDFTNVTFNGTTAAFTGSTSSDYNAIGGDDIVFDVTTSAVVPEPVTWSMLMIGFAGLGFAGYRKSRKAVSIAP